MDAPKSGPPRRNAVVLTDRKFSKFLANKGIVFMAAIFIG